MIFALKSVKFLVQFNALKVKATVTIDVKIKFVKS